MTITAEKYCRYIEEQRLANAISEFIVSKDQNFFKTGFPFRHFSPSMLICGVVTPLPTLRYRYIAFTHSGDDGDQITLRLLVVEWFGDGDLTLVRKVDGEMGCSVGDGRTTSSAFGDVTGYHLVLHQAVHSGVSVDGLYSLEDRRTHGS